MILNLNTLIKINSIIINCTHSTYEFEEDMCIDLEARKYTISSENLRDFQFLGIQCNWVYRGSNVHMYQVLLPLPLTPLEGPRNKASPLHEKQLLALRLKTEVYIGNSSHTVLMCQVISIKVITEPMMIKDA